MTNVINFVLTNVVSLLRKLYVTCKHRTKTLQMKLRGIIIIVFIICLTTSCSTNGKIDNSKSETIEIRNDLNKYFDDCNVDGSIAIYDYNNRKWILSDSSKTNIETLPASTFKIINLLVALETKTIKDENEIVKWTGKIDTIRYGFRPDIYRDMTVKEAFKVSAGWVFVELAKKIGKKNYQKYLTSCKYGNVDLSQPDEDFWNFGNFGITPVNQVEFLKGLFEGSLPFSKRNIEIVKEVMLTEQSEDLTIRSKTGWTRENETNTGWWVGYIENEKGVYIFATRLLQDRKNKTDNFGQCRIDVTKMILKDLNIMKRI